MFEDRVHNKGRRKGEENGAKGMKRIFLKGFGGS